MAKKQDYKTAQMSDATDTASLRSGKRPGILREGESKSEREESVCVCVLKTLSSRT